MQSYSTIVAAYQVALRKESVDRNNCLYNIRTSVVKSLSARRAWIEIPAPCPRYKQIWVALRKESVDRNRNFAMWLAVVWLVALRKESVDRNL